MRSKINFAACTIATLVFGLAALQPAGAAPAGDACLLLTPAQVTAALGVSVGPGTHLTPTFLKTCQWTTTDSANGKGGWVTLALQPLDSFQAAKSLGGRSTAIVVTPVSGIGDDAYYLAVGDNVGLIVKKGNVAFKVAVYQHGAVQMKMAKEKPLALQVVSKL